MAAPVQPGHAGAPNVAHHYDLSDQLYDLFLDRDRQYSCAYFLHPDDDIDTAQPNKKRHIAAKLLLRPGRGCSTSAAAGAGWRSTSPASAASTSPASRCRPSSSRSRERRAAPAGLSDRVRFQLRDYREESGSYDRIVSVGMFEHVGVVHYPTFFRKVRRAAQAGRRRAAALDRPHATGRARPIRGCANTSSPAAIRRRSPRSCRWSSGPRLWITDIEMLRLHYAETLKAWRARFLQQPRRRSLQLYDERFCRMWEIYLVGSRDRLPLRRPSRHPDPDGQARSIPCR